VPAVFFTEMMAVKTKRMGRNRLIFNRMYGIIKLLPISGLHWKKKDLFQWKSSWSGLWSINWKATYDGSYDSNVNITKASFPVKSPAIVHSVFSADYYVGT